MRAVFILFTFCLPFFMGNVFAQSEEEVDLNKISKSGLYKILKSIKYDLNREWTFYDTTDSCLTKQYLSMTNAPSFFKPPKGSCYRTKWRYVALRRNYINVVNSSQCKEPPSATITINRLLVSKERNLVKINIYKYDNTVSDSFEVLKIVKMDRQFEPPAYNLFLKRLSLKDSL